MGKIVFFAFTFFPLAKKQKNLNFLTEKKKIPRKNNNQSICKVRNINKPYSDTLW